MVFVVSGEGKFRRGIGGTGRWLEGLGFPFPQATARMIATTELAGGTLLLAGLFTHWVAIPLAINMMAATWTEKYRVGAPFQGSEQAQGYELTVLMVGAALALVLLGAGPLSLDALLG